MVNKLWNNYLQDNESRNIYKKTAESVKITETLFSRVDILLMVV